MKLRYPQPHSIKIRCPNEALESRMIDYLHVKAKHKAMYLKSKQSRRLYEKRN